MTEPNIPLKVSLEDGMVLLDGAGGVAVTLTPIAAKETAERLLGAAVEALAAQAAQGAPTPIGGVGLVPFL